MLRLIACVNEDGCIDGFKPPKADLQRFQALTIGSPIIMGRKTFETLPADGLLYRENIVVSRCRESRVRMSRNCPERVVPLPTLADAMRWAFDQPRWIIGGGEIYAQTINDCQMLYISHVKGHGGCVKFPIVNAAGFERIALQRHPDHDLCIYKRIVGS